METEIPKGRFEKKDNVFYAPVLRDKNTPVGQLPNVSSNPLIEGREMQGQIASFLFEETTNEPVEIDAINIGYLIQSGHYRV